MADNQSRALLFCNTLAHDEKDDVKLELIQFPALVDISELRVVPRGQWAHIDLKEESQFGQTSPSSFKLEFFYKSSKSTTDAIYQKIGNLEFTENGHFQLIPKGKITTEHVVVRGRYQKLTLCLYGSIASQRESSESPPPPPPPPPPPSHPVKEQPVDVKQVVEDISQIETIKSTSRPSDWDWEVTKETHPENPHYPDFPTQNPSSLEQKPSVPSPHPPVRRGPRTPSPPPPPSTEQWESQEPGEHWSEEEAVSPGEWQTEDLWEEGQTTEPAPEESTGNWEESDSTWETTDTWEPQDTGDWEDSERGEDWKREQSERRRKTRGPRTPPGEPRSPRSYEPKRKRRHGKEPEEEENMEERKRRRRKEEIFEPLSPERFPSDVGSHEEGEDEEAMGEAYEEISDEEVLEDEGFLENMDIDTLDTGGDVSQFDPFQFEPEPLKVLTSLESLKRKTGVPPTEDKERKSLRELLPEEDDRGPKWVAVLEEIPNLLPHQHWSKTEREQICDWTVQALDYSLAKKQPLAVNIRQLKAGMKLVSCLCNLDEDFAQHLVDRDVLCKLLALLFEECMASSLKILIMRALDSVSNWQVGLDKFLEQENDSYKKLLKFLMTEQTVRVVHAGSALLQKVHVYENLGILKDAMESIVDATPVKQLKEIDQTEGLRPPSSLEESFPDMPEAEYPNVDEALIKKLKECLDEVQSIFKKGAFHLMQPSTKAFPTSAAPSIDSDEEVWTCLHHMFAKRELLTSLTLVLCCPSTACNLSLVMTVKEILSDLTESLPGILLLASQPEVSKTLFQALTSSEEDEPDDFSLHQTGVEIMHRIAALHVLDSLMDRLSTGSVSEQREKALDCLEQSFSLTFNPVGRQALADVFSKEENLQYLLVLLRPKVPEEKAEDPQPKKNAVDGYLRHILWTILQYSEDVCVLHRHTEAIMAKVYDKDILKWLMPLKAEKFDASMAGPLVEYIQGCCDDLATDFTNVAPGILTGLRILKYLTCTPSRLRQAQQKDLSYQLAIMETFSSGGIPALSTCIKKISDFLLRPWQMGHCLTSKQQHLADSIALNALKILKSILTELFSTGEIQFRDDRPVSSVVSLYTVMCCAPPGGSLGRKALEVHQNVIDILLTYTTAPPVAPDSTQALSQDCWNIMLKVILEYIPSGLYTYLGGLSLLSDLLPLPLPLQTQEPLSQEDISQILQLRKLWSIHILCQSAAIQNIITAIAYTSSAVLQHMLRRVLCQLADLSAPNALAVLRFVLEAVTSKLVVNEAGNLEPSSVEVAQVLSLFVYLVSQPSIKAAFLELINSSLGSDDPLHDILKKLLTLMNIPCESSSHLQAQECVVASLQSMCSPEITLLSDEGNSTLDQLANSLPGKDHMELISTFLVDHVTSPSHSYASILPALRMIATLLDHDYGFVNVKGALLKQQGTLFEFYKRLTGAFTKDSSDYLSTLSTAVDLLHFMVSVESYQDEEQPEAMRYRTQALMVGDLKLLIKWETENHPLKQLEKILVECCKEDEKLETLLDSLSGLLQLLEGADAAEKSPDVSEQTLPPARNLTDQFGGRLVFFLSEEEDDRFAPGIWIGPPPMDEMDTDPEMVKCDLEEMRSTFIPDFNLKEELEKGLLTEDRSPDKPKHRRTRCYTALTSKGRGQFSNTIRRAHNSSFRGGKRSYDIFRQRAQNTSRPPSMHVDDFMNIENTPGSGDTQYNSRSQPPRRGMGAPRGSRGSRGGFRQWSGPSFRRDGGPSRGMPPRGRGGQWAQSRKPMRSNYHQGPPEEGYMQRRPDPRSEGRPPQRSPIGPQAYSSRPSSAERMRGGPYRGMRAMGPRGSPSPRRGGGGGSGGGRGYRGGHWTGDPHMRPQSKGMRGRPPPPGRHSRSFTR